MAIYLHFLDRELNSSVDARFEPQTLLNALRILLCTTDEKFYCSLSLILESSSAHEDFFKFIILLINNEILCPISHHPTLKEFFYSRKKIYEHDAHRYPMYFDEGIFSSLQIDSLPILHKETSTTAFLNKKIVEICKTPKLITDNHNFQNNANKLIIHETLQSGLDSLEDKAITFSAFQKSVPKNGTEIESFFIRRLISESYSSHYIDFLNADIITGIPEYSCYDYLSTNFPQYDFKILSLFFFEIFSRLSNYQKRNINNVLISQFNSQSHTDFIYIINRIIRASFKRIFSLTGLSLNHVLVRDQLIKYIRKNFIIPSLTNIGNLDSIKNILPLFTKELMSNYNYVCKNDQLLKNAADLLNIEDNNIMTTILIATATDLESKILYSNAEERGIQPNIKNFDSFSSVSLGVINKCDIYFVQSQMGSSGSGGSALTINDAIKQLKPDSVISLGIAFGADEQEQKIGDVLVSSFLRNYEPERVGSDKIIPRGERIPIDPTLISRCNTAKLTWKHSDIHTGLILSGEKLVDNSEFKKKLFKLEPEAIGGEMEGTGISNACYRQKVPWIIIKGICDWAEEKDGKNQKKASTNAINFFWHILESGGWENIN